MDSPLRDKRCDICGVAGYAVCIVTCCQCHQASEHIYCLRNNLLKVPQIWTCEDCQPRHETHSTTSANIKDHTEHMESEINTLCAVRSDVNCMTIDERRQPLKKQKTARLSKLISEGLFIPDNTRRNSIPSYRGTAMKSPDKAKVKFISAEEVAVLASGSTAKSPSSNQGASSSLLRQRSPSSSHPLKSSFCRNVKNSGLTSRKNSTYPTPYIDLKSKQNVNDFSLQSSGLGTSHMQAETSEAAAVLHDKVGCTKEERTELNNKNLTKSKKILHVPTLLRTTNSVPVEETTTCMDAPPGFSKNPHKEFVVQKDQGQMLIQDDILWKGSFEIVGSDFQGDVFGGINGRASRLINQKAFEAVKQMPEKLLVSVQPFSDVWPQIFCRHPPDVNDVAIYFSAGDIDSSNGRFVEFVELIESKDLAICCSLHIADLLIFVSKHLSVEGSNIEKCFWGVFRSKSAGSLASNKQSPWKDQSHLEDGFGNQLRLSAVEKLKKNMDRLDGNDFTIGDKVVPLSFVTSQNDGLVVENEAYGHVTFQEQVNVEIDMVGDKDVGTVNTVVPRSVGMFGKEDLVDQVDMEIDMVGGKDVGTVDVVVPRPVGMFGKFATRVAASKFQIKKNPSICLNFKNNMRKSFTPATPQKILIQQEGSLHTPFVADPGNMMGANDYLDTSGTSKDGHLQEKSSVVEINGDSESNMPSPSLLGQGLRSTCSPQILTEKHRNEVYGPKVPPETLNPSTEKSKQQYNSEEKVNLCKESPCNDLKVPPGYFKQGGGEAMLAGPMQKAVAKEVKYPEVPDTPPGFKPMPSPSIQKEVIDRAEHLIYQDRDFDLAPLCGTLVSIKPLDFCRGTEIKCESPCIHEKQDEESRLERDVCAAEAGHLLEAGLAIKEEVSLADDDTCSGCLGLFPMDLLSKMPCATDGVYADSDSLDLSLSRPRYVLDRNNIIYELSKEKQEKDGCSEGEQIKLTI